MAVIRPFFGVRYNPTRMADLSPVITQPYDRIGRNLREQYLGQHPHNFVRLILAGADPHRAHARANNPYGEVASLFRSWLQEGVLLRSRKPAMYALHQTFRMPDGTLVTRRACIAALQLTPFEEGTVLPHERTLSAPKADRLNLFRATQVNLEPVFLLYADPANCLNAAIDAAITGRRPDAEATEAFESDVRQQIWEVTDPEVLAALQSEMAPRRNLIIADGHHRYETALTYRTEMQRANPDAPADAWFNYALVALVSMDDPGLTILPTHRLVHSYNRLNASQIEAAVAQYFAVIPAEVGTTASGDDLATALRAAGTAGTAIGFTSRDRQSIWTLKDRQIMDTLVPERHPAWRELDVAVLHQLVLERVMGLTSDSIARQENLTYLRDAAEGRRAVRNGEAQFLFELNPTRIAQVRLCAEAGEKMPQKSTDFYPKMISGLVMMELQKSPA